VAEGLSISARAASRYASALFELMSGDNQISDLEKDIATLQEVLANSEDFKRFISSPIHTRDETRLSMGKIADYLGLGTYVKNTLGLMAMKRRLFVLPQFLDELKRLIDEYKGIVEVKVVVAHQLLDDEKQKLITSLEKKIGKEIHPIIKVDHSLIGGMRVSIGSKLIDSSIRTKLIKMKNKLQEVD